MSSDIVTLCYTFCDAIILYWEIYKDMNLWHPSSWVQGPLFHINNVTLQLGVIKEGTSSHPLGYEFFLTAVSIPDHLHSISFYAICNVSCSHSISRYYRQNKFHIFKTPLDVYPADTKVKIYHTKAKDYRTKASEQCKLMICAEIQDIVYKDNAKESITQVHIDKTIS
eukprot:362263_1